MLVKDSHRLSVEAIRPFLVSPEVYLKVYRETDSTNRAAKEAAVTGTAGHGGCVVAGKQTAGRGRRGRSFFSPEEAGLYLSVILKPQGSVKGEPSSHRRGSCGGLQGSKESNGNLSGY